CSAPALACARRCTPSPRAAEARRGRLRYRSGSRSSSVPLERLELVADGLDVDAEPTGRLGLVVARALERLEDEDALGLGHCHAVGDDHTQGSVRRVSRIVVGVDAELVDVDDAVASDDEGALEHVSKLANVARPRVGGKARQRGWRDAAALDL